MKILAIETSCDETAAAVVEDLPAGRQVGLKIISNVVASSKAVHEKYGGIVPEVAAREQLKCIIPVITDALAVFNTGVNVSVSQCINDHIDAIAVTVGPGLIGSLLVGVETAKTIAFVSGKPIIPVNHVIAHMYANFLDFDRENSSRAKSRDNLIKFPAISLVVSGGHTELYLMKTIKDMTWLGGTIDDAAGECFDKTARLLGFGHGGGVAVEKAAKNFKIKTLNFKLPRPMMDESLNFSFSGLKTAVMREWKKADNPSLAPAFSYEIQEAITDVLVKKTIRAAKQYGVKSILLSGGVAANTRLREKFLTKLQTNDAAKLSFYAPSPALCTDNAVMIAVATYFRGKPVDWHKITAKPDLSVD